MNCVLKPSLEHIAFTKVAVTLWNQVQDDGKTLTKRFRFRCFNEKRMEWKVIEDKVIEKSLKLPLPKPLKKKLLHFVYAVGLEILNWRHYHIKYFSFDRDLPDEICWTLQGTVDKKKTAEALIKNEKFHSFARYRLACVYCLEDDISKLWGKIPKNCINVICGKEPKDVYEQKLVVIWTYHMKGEAAEIYKGLNSNLSPYQYAFKYMTPIDHNKPATEYFLQRLTYKEREESLVATAKRVIAHEYLDNYRNGDIPTEYFSDVLCFLVSQMNEDQQTEVFKSFPYRVLGCFLNWPLQSHFMETANRLWDILSEQGYNCVLIGIVHKVMEGYKDCDYQNLFREFWLDSPNAHKKYVIRQLFASSEHLFLLEDLFQIEDIDNIRLILKSATVKEREEIIFSDKGKYVCEYLASSNKWNSLKFFIQECILSKEIMIKFKEDFEEYIANPVTLSRFEPEEEKLYVRNKFLQLHVWGKFFQFLDDLIQENKKVWGKVTVARPRDLTVQNLRE